MTRRTPRSFLAAPLAGALVVGALSAATLPGPAAHAAPTCTDGAVVGTEPVSLGVGCLGNLDPAALGTGLAFGYDGDTPRDGLAGATAGGSGGPHEGWGVADTAGGAEGHVAGGSSDNLTLVDFTVNPGGDGRDAAVSSTVAVGDTFEVTHDYRPSTQEGVYVVDVAIENVSDTFTEVLYRRVADLDVDPTGGDEVVTLQSGSAEDLVHLSDDGRASASPTAGESQVLTAADAIDAGPGDLGVLADLDLGPLPVGATKRFSLLYGATFNEQLALDALYALGAEAYALGQNSDPEGPEVGTPATYFLGFTAIAGTDMAAPTANDDSYTVTAGQTRTLAVSLNDLADPSVPDPRLEIVRVDPGFNGTVTCGTGACDYTPDAGATSDSFQYLLSDGHGGFDLGQVSITVEPGDQPAATNDARPTITGSGVVGEVLIGDMGTWTSTGAADGSDLSYARRWLVDGTPVAGETGFSYVPRPADVGKDVVFEVTVSRDGAEDVTEVSDPVTVVDEAAATNDVRPSISGTPVFDQELTGDDGSWTSGGEADGSDLTFTRRWLVDGAPAGTGTTYTPVAEDVGKQVVFEVTASRAGADDVVAVSDPVTVAAADAPELGDGGPRGIQTFPVRPTEVVSVSPGSWTPVPDSFSYVWEYQDWEGSPWAVFATTQEARVPVDLVFRNREGAVRVTVTAHRAGHASGTHVFRVLDDAIEGLPANTPLANPVLGGDASLGGTVTSTQGDWAETDGWTFHYNWYVNDAYEFNTTTDSSLFLDPDHVLFDAGRPLQDGDEIRVIVLALKMGHQVRTSFLDVEPLVIGRDATTVVSPPSITGTPKVRETLTLVPAVFEDDTVEVETTWYYRWPSRFGRRRVLQEGGTSVVLPDTVAGYLVEVEQVARRDGFGSVRATSDAVGPVRGLPQLINANARPTVAPQVGIESAQTTADWVALEPTRVPVADVTQTVEWLVEGVVVGTGERYTPSPDQVGGRLAARLTAVKDGYADGRFTLPFGAIRPADTGEAVLDLTVVRADDPSRRVDTAVVLCSDFGCVHEYADDGLLTVSVPARASGTDATLRLSASSLLQKRVSLTLTGGETTELTVQMRAPAPISDDADLSDSDTRGLDTDGDGVDDEEAHNVTQTDPQTLTVNGCAGLTGRTWTVVFDDGTEPMNGVLTETDPGVYVGEIPGFTTTGWAQIVTDVPSECGGEDPVDLYLYIDPSGIVADQFGRPIPAADVTLLKAVDDEGTTLFLPVDDGDETVMDPSVNVRNPSVTDSTGFFRWDVVAGDYQVRVSNATSGGVACAITTTPAMEVPPERVDLLVRTDCDGAERPEPTTAPVVTGDAEVGGTLSATSGEWAAPLVPQRVVWLRDGQAVATGGTYDVTEADLGASLVARAYAVRPDYVQEHGLGDVVEFLPTWADTAAVVVEDVASAASSVRAKLLGKKIRAGQKPLVRVRVRSEGEARPTGRVVVVLKGKGKTRKVTARRSVVLDGGRPVVKVRLPRLRKPGRYVVRVRYRGDALTEPSTAKQQVLRVTKKRR